MRLRVEGTILGGMAWLREGFYEGIEIFKCVHHKTKRYVTKNVHVSSDLG
jgi:hypothetical protein